VDGGKGYLTCYDLKQALSYSKMDFTTDVCLLLVKMV
jgi:hypothetical protein